MTIEAIWYSECAAGEAPEPQPLSAEDLADPKLALRLALDYHSGLAGYRPVMHDTDTAIWYWPRREGRSWLIPRRIEREAMTVLREAIREAARRNGGYARKQDIEACLRMRIGEP